METDKSMGDDLSGVFQARAIFSRGKDIQNRINIIAPVKYLTLILVTLSEGQLTHSRICLSLPFRLQDRQEGLGHPSARDMRRHHRGHCGLGLERGFPGRREYVHRGRGHRVDCRPGAWVCGPGRPGGEALDPLLAACAAPPVGLSSLPRRSQVRRRHGHRIIDAPLVQRLQQLA